MTQGMLILAFELLFKIKFTSAQEVPSVCEFVVVYVR